MKIYTPQEHASNVEGLKNALHEFVATQSEKSAKTALDFADSLHGYREDGLLVEFVNDIGYDSMSSVTIYYKGENKYVLLQRLSDGTEYLSEAEWYHNRIVETKFSKLLPLTIENEIADLFDVAEDFYGDDNLEAFNWDGEYVEMAIAVVTDLKDFEGQYDKYHISHSHRKFELMGNEYNNGYLTIRTTTTSALQTLEIAYSDDDGEVEIGGVEFDSIRKDNFEGFVWFLKNNPEETKRVFGHEFLSELNYQLTEVL